jgi:hypothetical protein
VYRAILRHVTTFTIDDNDLEDLVRRDLGSELRHQGPFPLGALAAAAVLVWIHPLLGAVALGMAIAWGYSLVAHLRAIRPHYKLRQGSLAGPLTIEFVEDGVWTDMPTGAGTLRWSQLGAIRNYPGLFVFEDQDGYECLILPKRHFSTENLALLQSKASELESRRNGG